VRISFPILFFTAILLIAPGAAWARNAAGWTPALDEAARTAPDARILVLDLHDGRILGARHLDEAARTLAAPGSTLKPLILFELLSSGRWNAERRVACDRSLVISGRRLACSHPAAQPFDARAALAWSCNRYFADAARTLRPGELGPLLRSTGLLGATGRAPGEALAEFREPRSTDEMQLSVLGVENIRVTPFELAHAYRRLASKLDAHPGNIAGDTVRAGLADSVESGMAQPASQNRISVAGKTGTAESAGSPQTHGWFAGFAPAENPQVVIVVYLSSGRGMDAAHIAGLVLAHAPLNATEANRP
jgi:cell division protein FtsI/penicillin-binding protein 2